MKYSDVSVKIDLASPLGELGFGYPLIYEKVATAYPYAECSSLTDVINAIAGFTATDTETVRETKTTAAMATNTYKAASLIFEQNDITAKIAVYGTDKKVTEAIPDVLENSWRQLLVVSAESETDADDNMTTIAEYIENTDKLYFCSVTDYTSLAITSYTRTVCLYYTDGTNEEGVATSSVICPEAAIVGAVASKDAGSVNYKNMVIAGLTPLTPSTATLDAIHAAGCMTVVKKAGDVVTTNGKSASGEYVDIIDGKDYIIQQVTYQTQRVLNGNDKIPYTNQGIAMLESACVNVMVDAFNKGIIATTDEGAADYTVEYGMKEATSQTDRANRRYIHGTFRFALAGAVDTVEIRGTIEI